MKADAEFSRANKNNKSMNWDAISAIAETIGTIAVVASLVYVAAQIRQNTRDSRMASFESAVRGTTNWHQNLAADPEMLRVLLQGQRDYKGLSPEDRLRFQTLMITWIMEYQNFKMPFDEGTIERGSFSDRSLGEVEKHILSLLRTPGGQQWWAGETYLNQDTRDELNRLLEEYPDVRFQPGDPYHG
jgi:hypothetical protein